ncbi:hypothetical protein [Nitrobacter winogradskyi]|uniref:Uncharacterized protein n=2 Tax=Nitrobacter winogradskyi TaxID=913 RepID=A0ACC6AD62_NITWI|nr:hypothetical protein [Nitrobacter winogradskyi]MCP1997611.1 hypothetical protein [Nitrobacter winogradskyi]
MGVLPIISFLLAHKLVTEQPSRKMQMLQMDFSTHDGSADLISRYEKWATGSGASTLRWNADLHLSHCEKSSALRSKWHRPANTEEMRLEPVWGVVDTNLKSGVLEAFTKRTKFPS